MPFLDNRSIVGTWKVIVPEGEFLIEFEHGTTSGKRVIWINGNEYLRKDWMFRLVGPEYFRIGRFECKIDVEPNGTFGLVYELYVNGLEVEQFQEVNKKKWVSWSIDGNDGKMHHVIFEKDTTDVWINGTKSTCEVHFIDGGNLTKFMINEIPVTIKSLSSGNKKQGMIYECIVGDEMLQPDTPSK